MRNFKLGVGKEFRVVFGACSVLFVVLFCSVLSCLVWRKEKKRVWSKDTFEKESDHTVQGAGRRMVRVVAVQINLSLSIRFESVAYSVIFSPFSFISRINYGDLVIGCLGTESRTSWRCRVGLESRSRRL